MSLKELIKTNPVKFWLFVIITILTPITVISSTALIQVETAILLSRNLRNFLIISAVSLVVFALGYVFTNIRSEEHTSELQSQR